MKICPYEDLSQRKNIPLKIASTSMKLHGGHV